MDGSAMPLDELLGHLERLANAALPLWDLPAGARARLINVSENATYLVEAPAGFRAILRVHREGYHSRRAIACELAWSRALAAAGAVHTPAPIPGRNRAFIQSAGTEGLAAPRHLVLFEFVAGTQPDTSHDLVAPFGELGAIAARTHLHSAAWRRPGPFERLTWDTAAVFGDRPTWGNWRDAPNVTDPVRKVLERVEATVCRRLEGFGRAPERFGLIHADMRLANLLIDDGRTWLIDFDDCGFGWFLYDFAAAISFMEDHGQVPALKASWVEGYRKVRPLSGAEEAEIDSFVMLRRLALLGWIGSHIEAPEPKALARDFARVSAELGEAYLTRMG